MSPVVRLSDNTYARLQSHGTPFEDKPEDVINRALDALDLQTNRAPTTDVLPSDLPSGRKRLSQQELRHPLLTTMIALGGEAHVGEIRKALEAAVASQLSEADHEPVSSGDPRWWNAVCWERKRLVDEGLFADNSPRGIWKITDAGRRHA